jgi:hypothetical protein
MLELLLIGNTLLFVFWYSLSNRVKRTEEDISVAVTTVNEMKQNIEQIKDVLQTVSGLLDKLMDKEAAKRQAVKWTFVPATDDVLEKIIH